jgi:hypothetical protein
VGYPGVITDSGQSKPLTYETALPMINATDSNSGQANTISTRLNWVIFAMLRMPMVVWYTYKDNDNV